MQTPSTTLPNPFQFPIQWGSENRDLSKNWITQTEEIGKKIAALQELLTLHFLTLENNRRGTSALTNDRKEINQLQGSIRKQQFANWTKQHLPFKKSSKEVLEKAQNVLQQNIHVLEEHKNSYQNHCKNRERLENKGDLTKYFCSWLTKWSQSFQDAFQKEWCFDQPIFEPVFIGMREAKKPISEEIQEKIRYQIDQITKLSDLVDHHCQKLFYTMAVEYQKKSVQNMSSLIAEKTIIFRLRNPLDKEPNWTSLTCRAEQISNIREKWKEHQEKSTPLLEDFEKQVNCLFLYASKQTGEENKEEMDPLQAFANQKISFFAKLNEWLAEWNKKIILKMEESPICAQQNEKVWNLKKELVTHLQGIKTPCKGFSAISPTNAEITKVIARMNMFETGLSLLYTWLQDPEIRLLLARTSKKTVNSPPPIPARENSTPSSSPLVMKKSTAPSSSPLVMKKSTTLSSSPLVMKKSTALSSSPLVMKKSTAPSSSPLPVKQTVNVLQKRSQTPPPNSSDTTGPLRSRSNTMKEKSQTLVTISFKKTENIFKTTSQQINQKTEKE